MNTLFIGSIRSTDTSLHYYNALTRMGHRTLNYDPNFFEASGPLEFVERKFNRGPTRAKLQQVHADLVRIVSSNRWDLIFVMGQNFLNEALLQECRKKAGPQMRLVYHSHDNLFATGILKGEDFFKTLEHYDHVFTTKSQNVELYKTMGQAQSHFLPSAFEPTVHRPISTNESRLEKKIPVSFIGTYDGSRNEIVEAVGWEKLEVWGDGWRRYAHYRECQHKIHPQAVYYFQFADITSQSQIALGLLRHEAQDRHTQRTFEIPACGAFQLSPRTKEIQSFFEEGREIECFDSVEELKSKTQFYLTHETERRKIAEAGYKRVLAGKHTYEDRVNAILEKTHGQAISKSA